MDIMKDSGAGVTEESLKFWNENKDKLGKIDFIEVSHESLEGHEEYNFYAAGTSLKALLLSGCNCGYGGTGPNGTAKIFEELGMPKELARKAMYSKKIVLFVQDKQMLCDGKLVEYYDTKEQCLNKQDIKDWLDRQPDDAVFCKHCLGLLKPAGEGFLDCDNEWCCSDKKVSATETAWVAWGDIAEISEQLDKEHKQEQAREVLQAMQEAKQGDDGDGQ